MWLIFLGGLNFFLPHALYVGVIELKHEPGHHLAHLTVKTFTNDLEDCLYHAFGTRYKLTGDLDSAKGLWSKIENYISEHTVLNINRLPTDLTLVKVEVMQDSYWMNFKVECPLQWNFLELKAAFLMELFPDQVNVVHIKEGPQKQFFRLNKHQSTITVPVSH